MTSRKMLDSPVVHLTAVVAVLEAVEPSQDVIFDGVWALSEHAERFMDSHADIDWDSALQTPPPRDALVRALALVAVRCRRDMTPAALARIPVAGEA